MSKLVDQLAHGHVLVSDGAWGTALQGRGIEPGVCPESWNLDHPEVITEIADEYLAAGAQLLTTNTFGACRLKLRMYGLEAQTAEINRAAASLARQAAGDDRYVLGSVGPSGQIIMMGDISERELSTVFEEEVIALEEGGCDVCLVETMMALDEAALAVRAAREHTSMEVVCTFTFQAMPDGSYRTMMGVSPTDMASAMLSEGADIIGANCSVGSRDMVKIVQELRRAAPSAPILVSPNAGQPVRSDSGEDVFPETPEDMAAVVPDIIDAGANIIGGCCGTTAAHVGAIAEAVSNRRPKA